MKSDILQILIEESTTQYNLDGPDKRVIESDEFDTVANQILNLFEEKKYTKEDMLAAAKYGYEFRDTTSFPEHKFEDNCINNTKQWLLWYNKENN
jgi:hypothetical protein